MKVLVLGATGYIGGRLVPCLLEAGHDVRCMARTPAKLSDASWVDEVEVVRGDATDPASTLAAAHGCDAIYYLVHSIGEGADWESIEHTTAVTVRDAADAAGVGQIIYLGGLGASDSGLSSHLASRQLVGTTLADGPVPVTELQAAVIIGSGSASFEMLRHLVEVLPAMITPRWVSTRCQPIAVRDVLTYLMAVLDNEECRGRVLQIGGPDVLTYREMMQVFAETAGLRPRPIVTVPLLTPRLSSLWIGLVTPLPTALARPLIDSLVNEVVVTDDSITRIIDHEPISYRRALELALARVRDLDVTTRWSDATSGMRAADPLPTDPEWAGGTVLEDSRSIEIAASAEAVFATIEGIGGERGWFGQDWLWDVRGLIDLAVGGVGPRRGRRHPDALSVGDAVDSFRVEVVDPPRLLRLRVEMRLPGEGWLEWRVTPGNGTTTLVQKARFHPRGIAGRLYWWTMLPFHGVIFRQMLRRLARAAPARTN